MGPANYNILTVGRGEERPNSFVRVGILISNKLQITPLARFVNSISQGYCFTNQNSSFAGYKSVIERKDFRTKVTFDDLDVK